MRGYKKYVGLGLFAVVAVLVGYIIWPLMKALVAGALLAYVAYPVYTYLRRWIRWDAVRASIVSVLLLLVILVPFVAVIQTSAPEARYLFLRSKQIIASVSTLSQDCTTSSSGLICLAIRPFSDLLQDPSVRIQLENFVAKVATAIIDRGSDFFLALPQVVLQVFVTFFSLYYFLKDEGKTIQRLYRLVPLSTKHKGYVSSRLREVMRATVFGTLLIAVIQGALAWVGYTIFGLPSAIIWAIMTGFFALLPVLGTSVVWVPASFVLIASEITTGTVADSWRGIGLLIYGILIIGSVDNILRPKIIGSRAAVHPVLVLVGAIGGLGAFGFVGFFIGPVILALAATLLEVYEREVSQPS